MRIDTEALKPGVWVFRGFTNGNVLALDTPEGVLLVDAQSAKRVASLDSALRRVTPRPVRWVVNTHYHEDHTGGNGWFRERGARVLAHVNAVRQASKDTTITEMQWHRTPLPAGSMPTDTLSGTRRLTLGREVVEVTHPGAAHTDGDALLWLAGHNILHIGDLFEVGAPPFVDWWAGGSMDGMLRAIDEVLMRIDDATLIVPGHGATSRKPDLVRYRGMLATVQSRVRTGLSASVSPDSLAAQAVRGFEESLGGERRARQFGGQVVQGLRRERRP